MTFYALVQKGVCIMGLGTTKEEAIEEICEWTDIQDPADLDYTEYYISADEDTFVLLECTERLYNHVLQHGSTVYDVINNIADVYNQ